MRNRVRTPLRAPNSLLPKKINLKFASLIAPILSWMTNRRGRMLWTDHHDAPQHPRSLPTDGGADGIRARSHAAETVCGAVFDGKHAQGVEFLLFFILPPSSFLLFPMFDADVVGQIDM